MRIAQCYRLIVPAMAGGPSTPKLVQAVAAAGGFGFLATGTIGVEQARQDMRACKGIDYGINLFAAQPPLEDLSEVEEIARQLGVEVPEVDYSNQWQAKFDAICEAGAYGYGPRVVSATFGCFTQEEIAHLHELGVEAWACVATAADAREALARGVDELVVQGPEAGGHRYTWSIEHDNPSGSLDELIERCPGEVIATGGIVTPAQVARVLGNPKVKAVACGSAFLLAHEAGTSEPNRRRLREGGNTVATRAFSGRFARGRETGFTQDHPQMPPIYPHLNKMLAPRRAQGEEHVAYCLVGAGIGALREASAAEIYSWLSKEL